MGKKYKFSWLAASILLAGAACKKQEIGFLSDNIYYIENPFTVPQGSTLTSAVLVGDGSTAPLYVDLLAVKDSAGGSADSMFLKPQQLYVYKDAVSYTDSTTQALYAKLGDSLVAPFSVNSIGGRLQFTATTTFVTPGTYSIDIGVHNVRGSRKIPNACTIDVTASQFFVLVNTPYSYLLDTVSQARVYFTPEITAVHDPAGAAVISIKWEDEDGAVFNPLAGEVVTRPGLASFDRWDPYYPVQLTDTAFVYQYPDKVPLFPAFSTALVRTGTTQDNYMCYYRTPAKFIQETGQEYRTGFAFNFPNAIGSYSVTIRMVGAHRKPS